MDFSHLKPFISIFKYYEKTIDATLKFKSNLIVFTVNYYSFENILKGSCNKSIIIVSLMQFPLNIKYALKSYILILAEWKLELDFFFVKLTIYGQN